MIQRFIFFVAFLFVLAGCSTQKIIRDTETTVRDTTLTVVPPEIRDTLQAITRSDSTIEAINIRPGTVDTITVIRYYPLTKKVTVYVKPDTVRLTYRDTVTITRNEIHEERSIFDKVYDLIPFLVIGIVLFFLWKVFK